MTDEHNHDDDELELNADQAEELLIQFGEQLDTDVDLDRLREAIRLAVGSHPDRDNIVELMQAGAHFFIEPLGEDVELRVGFFADPALNPPGAPAGRSQPLGLLPVSHVRRRPEG
jgi:hypothetical protein